MFYKLLVQLPVSLVLAAAALVLCCTVVFLPLGAAVLEASGAVLK